MERKWNSVAFSVAPIPASSAPPSSGQPRVDAAAPGQPAAGTEPDATSAFFHAYQLCQMLQQVNAVNAMTSAINAAQQQQQQQPPSSSAPGAVGGLTAQASAAGTDTPGTPTHPSRPASLAPGAAQFSSPYRLLQESPPHITPPATPPAAIDSSIAAVLAQLTQKATSNVSQPALPAAVLSPVLNEAQFCTPTKRKAPSGECPSPADSLPTGLKRLKVRVLQNNSSQLQTQQHAERLSSASASPVKSPASDLVARLANAACTTRRVENLPHTTVFPPFAPQYQPQPLQQHLPNQPNTMISMIPPVKDLILPKPPVAANPPGISAASRLSTVTNRGPGVPVAESERSTSGWTDAEKRELLRLVADYKPSGASSWGQVARLLFASGTGHVNRGASSVERMYRTLTDPSYTRSGNKHGRRLNPRKGTTPMHVMATYSLQQLPDNEGNLTQITDLIVANERFAAELDWTPRPGTKTYPRWKDALVGCFKPGRYPHLVKTDRKFEGLNIYKLLKENLGESQRVQFEQMAAANNLRQQQQGAAITAAMKSQTVSGATPKQP